MDNRKKVIKGLGELSGFLFKEYGKAEAEEASLYYDRFLTVDNAITLLKEQEGKWIEYPECLGYDGAYSDSHIVCSACKHVFSTMDNCTEEFDYCPHCGAKMNEGRRSRNDNSTND